LARALRERRLARQAPDTDPLQLFGDSETTQVIPAYRTTQPPDDPQHTRRIGLHRLGRLLPGRRLKRRGRWFVYGLALPTSVLLVILLMCLTVLNGPLTKMVADQVAREVACPATATSTATAAPKVTVGGGRILPQLARRRLSEIDLRMSDTSLGGISHADLTAKLRDVRRTRDGASVGKVNAALTIGFAALPSPPDTPRPTFGRSPDGSLTITVVPPAEVTARVKTTLLAKLELRGETITVVPQRLLLFGRSVPPARVAAQIGGARTEQLPHLPDGLTYRSVAPRPDGLHIEVGGVVTTPFSELPATIGGNPVSYSAVNGQLGISISKRLPLLGNLNLTIFTAPRVDGNTLTFVPQSVEIFGHNRSLDDPIAALILRNIDQSELSRGLPALPDGVGYHSASVNDSGIGLAVDGVAVKPYSELPATVDGRPTSYSAQDDLLAITTTGIGAARPTPVVLHTTPTIAATVLRLKPHQIEILGLLFPAREVLATTKMELIEYPLLPLPGKLAYRDVKVMSSGLRITLEGRHVTLHKGELRHATCP
jgi:hypothetical protein